VAGRARLARPLPRALPITGNPLSSMGLLSPTICRATIAGAPLRLPVAARVRAGEGDPVVHRDRSSIDVGWSFVPLNTRVVYRLAIRESSSRRLWLDEVTS